MGKLVDSKERTAGEFMLFALGFAGFVIAATGIVVNSPGGSVFGWLLLLLTVLCFVFRSPGEEP